MRGSSALLDAVSGAMWTGERFQLDGTVPVLVRRGEVRWVENWKKKKKPRK